MAEKSKIDFTSCLPSCRLYCLAQSNPHHKLLVHMCCALHRFLELTHKSDQGSSSF